MKDGKSYFYDSELANYYPDVYCVMPTYLEVWYWLETEKKIIIHPNFAYADDSSVKYATTTHFVDGNTSVRNAFTYNSSEEAIVAAIEYLVTNNLIK